MRYLLFLFLSVLSVLVVFSEDLKKNPCSAKKHCGECIMAHSKCAWCSKENYGLDGKPRCDYFPNLLERGCDTKYIIDPQNQMQLVDSKPLSMPGTQEHFVQIFPQKTRLRVRPKRPLKFQIKFRQAEDYPIDLYYLMDLSNSMEDDKEKLASLGDLLATSMRNITSNFKVGFGSFVDKVVMPYVSVVPEKLVRPCERCAAPYSFRNHLGLTSDVSRFAHEIKSTPVSGNLDAPEGGLDAIMQVIACREQIGWRPHARHLLIYSSDASFHFAGDGKLGGIVIPNDGQCHLDNKGYYTHGNILDYPSVSQIIQKVREKSVNVIFAITGEQLSIYQKFSEILEGSTVGQLANDSSNIVELVKENYNKITSKVELKDNAPPNMTLTYESTCLDGKLKKTKVCDGLKVGDTVTFDVTLTLDSCVTGRRETEIRINPIGISEQLTINVESICECDCAYPPHAEINSPKCSGGHGTFECGTCKCHESRFGRNCECNSMSATHMIPTALEEQGFSPAKQPQTLTMTDYCIRGKVSSIYANVNSTKIKTPLDYTNFNDASNSINSNINNEPFITNDIVCSGRGDCICGICECWPRENALEIVSGQFCECDNFSCDRYEGKVCGGPGRGTCECGTCNCAQGWIGDACQCPNSNATCIASNGKLCNGVGVCDCGVCICNAKPNLNSNNNFGSNYGDSYESESDSGVFSERYRGPTCEECPTCPGLCSQHRACVQCTVFGSGPLSSSTTSALPEISAINKATTLNPSILADDEMVGKKKKSSVHITTLECDRQCGQLNIITVDDLIQDSSQTPTPEQDIKESSNTLCQFKDDDGCTFYFTYLYDANHTLVLKVQKTKACPQPPKVLAIILPIVIGITIIGLALLFVWKILTMIHDRREYAKFQKHLSSAKWDTGENPIFRQATSTYRNPTFQKNR